MMYGYWGWGLMPMMMIICFVIIIAIVIFFARSSNTNGGYERNRKSIEILDEKFASGEISEEEYKRKKQVLNEK